MAKRFVRLTLLGHPSDSSVLPPAPRQRAGVQRAGRHDAAPVAGGGGGRQEEQGLRGRQEGAQEPPPLRHPRH